MALVARSNVSLASATPPANCRHTGNRAFESLVVGDAVYIRTDGTVAKSVGAAGVVDGFAGTDVSAGDPVTILRYVNINYGTGLTPGTNLYLDAATAGRLNDSATGNGPLVARTLDAERVFVKPSY